MKLSQIYSVTAMFLMVLIYAPLALFSEEKPERVSYETDTDYNGIESKD
ncbi:MAG: hypothetical protein ACAH12_09250 [Methylophilaceae bacterium]